jgi:hypothetical protein
VFLVSISKIFCVEANSPLAGTEAARNDLARGSRLRTRQNWKFAMWSALAVRPKRLLWHEREVIFESRQLL